MPRAPKRRGSLRKPRPTSARETEAKVKAAADKIDLKVESAKAQIRDALHRRAPEIEAVAAEATQEMVAAADRHLGRPRRTPQQR